MVNATPKLMNQASFVLFIHKSLCIVTLLCNFMCTNLSMRTVLIYTAVPQM